MKKLLFFLSIGMLSGLILFPLRCFAGQPDFEISSTDGSRCYNLLDGDYGTIEPFFEETTLTITAQDPISGLFVIWEYPPGEWTLMDGDQPVTCGQDSILHEFIPLSGTSDTVSFTVSTDAFIIADIYVLSGGDVPPFVQVWKKAWEEPVDILLFGDQEGDEQLFRGLIPEDARVQAAYYTDHFYSEPFRNHVILSRLWNLGVDHFPALGVQSLSSDDPVSAIRDTVRRFRPQLILVPDNSERTRQLFQVLESLDGPQKVVAVSADSSMTQEEVMKGIYTYALQDEKEARAELRSQSFPEIPEKDVETNLKAGHSLKVLIYMIAALVLILAAADFIIIKTRRTK